MIRRADIERVAQSVLLEGSVGDRRPPVESLAWALAGTIGPRSKARFPPGDLSPRTEDAAWLALGLCVGERLAGERDGSPVVGLPAEQVRLVLEDDGAVDGERDGQEVRLRAVDVDPDEATDAAEHIAIDGGATDAKDAAATLLHGLEVGLRLKVGSER